MARSMEWWVLATAAAAFAVAALALVCIHGPPRAPAVEDPIGRAMIGQPEAS